MAYEYVDYYGNMWFRTNCVPDSQFPPHYHGEFEILYVLSGTAVITLPDRHINVNRGEAVFINRNAIHMYSSYFAQMPVVLCTCISPDICRDYYPQFADFRIGTPLITPREHPLFIKAYLDFVRVYYSEAFHPSDSTPLKLMSLVTKLCASVLSEFPQSDTQEKTAFVCPISQTRMNEILDYIVKNHAHKLTLTEVSKEFYMDLYYLSHLFRYNIGMPFQKYLSGIRLDHAIRLINANPDISLTDLCFESGFSAPKYLNAAFMEAFQCSPGEYRANMIKGVSPVPAKETSAAGYPFPYIHLDKDEYMKDTVLKLTSKAYAEIEIYLNKE